jgi:hypothetical protein
MAQPVSISTLVRQPATQLQPSTHSPSLLKRKEILMLLTKFSLRRGAPVTPETLALYTEDLSNFELNDIADALEKFGTAVPEQYEAAFPCIGVFIRKVTSVENRRKRAEQEAKERAEEQEKQRRDEEDRRLNPEKYEAAERDFQERLAGLKKRYGVVDTKPTPTPPPVMTSCPHCDNSLPLAAGIRLMSAKEVIEMGQLMERMEAQAAQRKEAL